MGKETSVGIEFTGDSSGFQRVVGDMNKSLGTISKSVSGLKGLLGAAGLNQVLELGNKAWNGYKKVMDSTEGSADKLEEQMGQLKGTVQGAMITLFSGDWKSLITNIKNTADATRDLVKAQDELTHAQARNTISKGDLEIKLQATKLLAGSETDKGKKKAYLEEAIGYQKQITAITVSELQNRANATEQYYKQLFGGDEEYWNYVKDNIVTVAKNYDYLYGNLANIKKRLSDLDYSKGLSPLSGADETERRRLQLTVYLLEDYTKLQDQLSKKGQFEEFLTGLGAIRQAAAAGDAEILRMTKQITTLGVALDKAGNTIKRTMGPAAVSTSNLSMPTFSSRMVSSLAGPPSMSIKSMTASLEAAVKVTGELQKAFESLFTNAGGGFKGMVNSMINSIEMLVAELAAKAVILAVLKIITGGLAPASLIPLNMPSFAPSLPGLQGPPAGLGRLNNVGNNTLSAVIKGRDIYLSNQRYASRLGGNT